MVNNIANAQGFMEKKLPRKYETSTRKLYCSVCSMELELKANFNEYCVHYCNLLSHICLISLGGVLFFEEKQRMKRRRRKSTSDQEER